jgi:hypothetical protein
MEGIPGAGPGPMSVLTIDSFFLLPVFHESGSPCVSNFSSAAWEIQSAAGGA